MNLTGITQSSKFSNLIINKTAILHIIPDFGLSVVSQLHQSGISLTNCQNVVIKIKPLKISGKTFTSRNIYLDSKKELENSDIHSHSLRILQVLPEDIIKNKFIIIDNTINSQISQHITEITNPKRGLFVLFQQLKKEFKLSKTKFPEANNIIIFLINPNTSSSIYELIKKIQTLTNDEVNDFIGGFDNNVLVSITSPTPSISPIIQIDKHGKIEILKSNITYLNELINKFENSSSIPETPVIYHPVRKTKLITPEINSKYEINQTQLSKIIKKYKIKDKTIGDNIKNAIDNYVESIPNKKDIKSQDLEKIVFKSIHHTLFGTDEISEEYQNSPIKLISKLEEVNTYSKKLVFPDIEQNRILDPRTTIQLDRVTGLVRQEYEFSDNIHINIRKLFSSLENKLNYPIKIKNFKYKYQDNHLNRFINYEITLQNTSGGHDKPYTVNIKIPALVNDRYFKLNGKQYILSNQQYMIPITKTDPNECRLLTAYTIITLSVVNLKFNLSQISEILEYIKIKYPNIISNLEMTSFDKINKIEFKDGTIINLSESPYYIYKDSKLISDDHHRYFLENKDGQNEITVGKSEFLYQILLEQIKTQNPEDILHKSKKSIPYIQSFISGFKCPLILFLWQQLGLINSLIKLGIDFKIIDTSEKDTVYNELTNIMFLSNDKKLIIYNKNKRDQLITNGLLTIDKKFTFSDTELNDKNSIVSYLQNKCGSKIAYQFDLAVENVIDPISKELLEFQDYPTNLIPLLTEPMIDKLLNDPADSLSDLKIYRSRQAEIMFHLMYKVLSSAHNTYRNSVQFGDSNSKLFLRDEYVIECLLGVHPDVKGNSSLELTNTYSPVAELKAASKIIKTGVGGIPNKRSFKKAHRNVHKSQIGNIGANATSEYEPVGLVTHMTLTPLISNQYGSFGVKDANKIDSGWDYLSLDESLVPFINELDATRAILAYTHRAQANPVKNSDEPIVATGAEFIIPQISSNKFIQLAKDDGVILEIKNNEYIKVRYGKNKIDYVDITPRLSMTKRATYINLSLNTLNVGDKFKKNQMIAWTDAFNGECYAGGKNLTMAVMNYIGFSHEDGYVISDTVSKNMETEIVDEITIIVPDKTKVLNFNSEIGINTKSDDILIEFSYIGDLEEYIDKYNIMLGDEEEYSSIYSLTSNSIKVRSPGGEISQIRIYINNKDTVDPIIIEKWNDIIKSLKLKQKLFSTNSITDKEKLSSIDNLDMSQIRIGTHKHYGVQFTGAKITFFIKRSKTLEPGDKLSNRYGGKGLITHIIPEDKIPYSENNVPIDIFISPISIFGRKSISIIKELYIGKIIVNLKNKVLKKLNTNTSSKSIKDFILHTYELLDSTPKHRYSNNIKTYLNSLNDVEFRNLIKNNKLKFNFIVEPFINIPMASIKSAAEFIDIELDEKVYIPELKCWTKTKVPVGYCYMNALEQLAEDYETLRSTGSYASSSGQPKKGRKAEGGSSQAIGNLDIYALLSYDCPAILDELMTIRSDDFSSKRRVFVDIVQSGSSNIPDETGNAVTRQLYNKHMIAMGLKVT